MTITKNKVSFSRKTWEKLKSDAYTREIIELIEDSEELEEAIKKTDELIDLREYDRKRRNSKVQSKN